MISLGEPSFLGGPRALCALPSSRWCVRNEHCDNVTFSEGNICNGFWEATDSEVIPPGTVLKVISPGEGRA